MVEYLSISKQNPAFPAYLDFQTLRQIGITRLTELAGKLWTDYNLHDPGVTILEVLCYAITDLGYRNNLDIEDLLALPPGTSENNFFTPDQILTCNPVTDLDIRKRLIDIDGVHNAWLEKVKDYEPKIWIDVARNQLRSQAPIDQQDKLPLLNPRGLYRVYLDLDPDFHKNACGQLYQSWSDVLDEVKQVLCRYRNLCEDIHDIVILGEEEIRLCADIQLEPDADAEDVLVDILGQVQNFLVPPIHFYTLQQLLEKNLSIAEIFAGIPTRNDPDQGYESHGFIDTHELENLTLPNILHASDFYQVILNLSGVVAIKKLLIASSINGIPQSQESPWYLPLTPMYRPVLSIQDSTIRLFKNGLPAPVNLDEVRRRYYEQRAAYIKTNRFPYELDLAVPKGKYSAKLATHYSIHYDFPPLYGIGEDGLPEPVSVERQAQVKQLKGYLVFFDQLLADYLAQLAHARDLFSWKVHQEVDKTKPTYFKQAIQFPGWEEILQPNYLDFLPEEAETSRDRKNRFLDHLLARFAESFSDYVLLNQKMFGSHQDKSEHETHLIEGKADFLKNYPAISRDRFRAFNYCKEAWDPKNVSGFKKRVSHLLGMENEQRRDLNHYKVELDPGGFIVFIRCGSSTLTSKQVYATQEEAYAGLEKFLSFALCANYYKSLTYKYFYHYGWEVEVIDEREPIQARYKPWFLSQGDRAKALQTLIQYLPSLEPEITILSPEDKEEKNLYYFHLSFSPVPSEIESLQFIGVQRYFSEEVARNKANVLLHCIQEPKNYHKIFFLTNGDAERETPDPTREARFSHYGYALIDHEGTVLAESSQRFANSPDRDADLKQWLSTIRAAECAEFRPTAQQIGNTRSLSFAAVPPQDQFKFVVQINDDEKYYFILQDTAGNIVLRSLKSYTAQKVWENACTFAENLFYLNRYVSPAQDPTGQTNGIGITNGQGELLAIAETQSNPLALFKRLNAIEPFLSIQSVLVPSQTEQITRYRCQLHDRDGTILLEATQLFDDADTARDRFYSDVLGLLFEPGMRYISSSSEGFGFGVLSKPGDRNSKVAVHPQNYTSEPARDAVLNRLFLLVRTARVTITLNPLEQAYVGRIYEQDNTGQNKTILLQETQRYAKTDEGKNDAWKQGNTILELASAEVELSDQGNWDSKNFRLIDGEDSLLQTVYGWELTNEAQDQILANHFYPSKSLRNESIQALRRKANDEGFHVLEHILLRPRQPLLDLPNATENSSPTSSEKLLPIYLNPDEAIAADGELFSIARRDPYSFWISIILPYWPERFQDINFRRFVERTLRLEAPAHVALKIAWVDARQMDQFETAYRAWLEQLARTSGEEIACNLVGSLNRLIDSLTQLRNVYPPGNLSSDQESFSQTNPIILNQTPLGRPSE